MVLCFFQLLKGLAQSNEGNLFWTTFMPHVDVSTNTKVIMITSRFNTSGQVTIDGIGYSSTFNVKAFEVTLVTMPQSSQLSTVNKVDNLGIKIETKLPCAVYIHQYARRRSEASIVLPVNVLGTEYYVMSHFGLSRNNTAYNSQFSFIASEDNTNIDVTLSANAAGGKMAGSNFSVNLNRGQTYLMEAANTNLDLTGTSINSDKPIAVFSGNPWTEVPRGCGTFDNLIEQMYPVATWGNEFIGAPSANVKFDTYRVLASEDSTLIKVGVNNFLLNKGEYKQYDVSGPSFITANKPIQVAQFLIGSECSGYRIGDPSMLLLNPIEQNIDTVILYNSSLQNIEENYINIVLFTDDVPLTKVDNLPLLGQVFASGKVPGTPYSFYTLKVNEGSHIITTTGCGVIASAYGYGQAESYAYAGGARFKDLRISPIIKGGCLNDTVNFDLGLKVGKVLVRWNFGDGATSTEIKPNHIYRSVGEYKVQVEVDDLCTGKNIKYEQNVTISLRSDLSVVGDSIVCLNKPLQLLAKDKLDDVTYTWTSSNGFKSDSPKLLFVRATLRDSGIYTVVSDYKGCKTYPKIVHVLINDLPKSSVIKDTFLCEVIENITFKIEDFEKVNWSDGQTGGIFQTNQIGKYEAAIIDSNGCENTLDFEIFKFCTTRLFVPNIIHLSGQSTNKIFKAQGTNIEDVNFKIYDRYGNLVYNGQEWDGTSNGRPVETGVYTYLLTYTDFQKFGKSMKVSKYGDLTVLK
jgi:gliding motility-associated-like protein